MTQRSDQIVIATLELLAGTPVDRVTTRQIAAHLDLTQPALFRHFASRDAILDAAVGWAGRELERLATEVLATAGPPLECVERLALSLATHTRRWPGLPRLLFADVAGGEPSSWGRSLRGIVARQRALVTELVREAVRRGEAPADVDAERAGVLFVAGMQGVLSQWLLSPASDAEGPDVAGFVAMWRAGVAAGCPRAAPLSATENAPEPGEADRGHPAPHPGRADREHDVHVDAIALLGRGVDPLEDILAAAGRLAPGGQLHVTAPFIPGPLVALLRGRGWDVDVAPDDHGNFRIDASRPATRQP